MPKFLKLLIPIMLFVTLVQAQESMIPNISYTLLEKLIIAAKMNYPKYKTFEERVKIADLNITKAQVDWLSIFTVSGIYSPTNATNIASPTLNGFQLAVSTSLGLILQKPNLIKNAKHELIIAKENMDEYNINLTALVKQKYYTYVQQLTILNWRIKALEESENTLKQIKYKFEKGEESFENYNRVSGNYTSAVQSKIESEGNYLNAKNSLEELVGVKIEDIK